jgi:hypothetical protein
MRREIGNPGAPASSAEGGLDGAAGRCAARGFGIGFAIGSPKNATLAMLQFAQRIYYPGVERDAACLAVLGFQKLNLAASDINFAPVEVKRFANPAAGVEQKNNERAKVRFARADQAIRFRGSEVPNPAGRLGRSLDLPPFAHLAFRRVLQHGRYRRVDLPIASCRRRLGKKQSSSTVDRVLIDLGERGIPEVLYEPLLVPLFSSGLEVEVDGFEVCCDRLSPEDARFLKLPGSFREELFGGFSVSSSRTLIDRTACDGTADIPVFASVSANELEHGNAS